MYYQEQASRDYQKKLESKLHQTEAWQKDMTDYLAQLEEALTQSKYEVCSLEARLVRVGWEKESLLQSFNLERTRAKEMELRLATSLGTESHITTINGGEGYLEKAHIEAQGNIHATMEHGRLGDSISTLRATGESLDNAMQQFTEALPKMRERVRYAQVTAEDDSRRVLEKGKDPCA